DPTRMRYLHLVDGGVVDNFGLTTLTVMRRAAGTPFAPLSERDAVRVRRALFLVVNAEKTRQDAWPLSANGPDGPETMRAALDASVDFSKRVAYDAFTDMLSDWRRDLIAWRCGLSRADVIRLRGDANGWRCDDVQFNVDMISFADLSPAQFDQ